MNNNKVSIIVPIYNVCKYLEKSVRSLLNQTYKNIEIILVDDGSYDGSEKICDEIALKDNRVKVIHKKNGGVSSARNEGLRYVTGEYLYFMDADDLIEKDFIDTMIHIIEDKQLDICICNFTTDYRDKEEKFSSCEELIMFNSVDAIKEMLRQDDKNLFLGHLWNKLFIFEKVKDIRFNEVNSVYEDMEYVYKALKRCDNIAYIPYIGYHYIQRNQSAMNTSFSEKTFTSINVVKYIMEDVMQLYNDFELQNIVISYYIRTNLKQASLCCYYNGDKKKLKDIQNNIKMIYKSVNENQYYTIKDKIFIKLICFNIDFFRIFYSICVKPKKRKIMEKESRRLYTSD